MPKEQNAEVLKNMLGVKKLWKNVQIAANGLPACLLMVQMILGSIGAIVLAASVIVSFSRKLGNVMTKSVTKDIGSTNINPIVQVQTKL